MQENRTQGVSEARFALTLVICALAAVGFVVLLRLGGGPGNSTIELRPDEIVVQQTQPVEDDGTPRVLPVEGSSRPQEVATLPHHTTNDSQKPPVLNPPSDAQRR